MSVVDLSSRKEEKWSSLIPKDLSSLIPEVSLILEEGESVRKKRCLSSVCKTTK